LKTASNIRLPFDSKDTFRDYTALSPSADDVDFYQIREPLKAGTTLVAEVLTGQIDSVLGLYRCNDLSAGNRHSYSGNRYYHGRSTRCDADDAELVPSNDDSNRVLSKIVYEVPEDGVYVIAVSYFGDLDLDLDLDGEDPGQGATP
jgi:hypothetical protein